ncbi:outer membrane beta-barrel protein [Marinobacter sp. BGYM27]|uniref:outer membrane beta-barrel protein n=1 Tax=Marinobacter sp. BGYM27 TaxID=2975597 RepID=UPI0021A4DE25|nr:outer membrane beta-barrel protein [Marinobacter sp. BGYM27]MDG5499986.1 outer membrane beta-barrel protein [Marinobacter sp. BGYM27]
MTGRKMLRASGLVLGSLAFMTTAQADEAKSKAMPYAGVSVGQSIVTDFCDDLEPLSCDDKSLAVRAYFGASFSEYIGGEVGFTFVDDVEASGSAFGASASLASGYQAFDGTMLFGTSRDNDFRLFAKAGIVAWNYDSKGYISGSGMVIVGDEEESGVSFRTGLGALYNVTDNVSVRLDWDFIPDIGDDETTGETDLHILSVGPQFRF